MIAADLQKQAEQISFDTRPFINGRRTNASANARFVTENPATATPLAEWPDCGPSEIDQAVSAARSAFRSGWGRLAPGRRKALLLDFAAEIRTAADQLALVNSLEMGKPIAAAMDEAAGCADFLQYYAEYADKLTGGLASADTASTLAMTVYEPRGVVGAIVPWNYPLMTAISALAPALAAGNTLVLKPSEVSPSSALMLGELAAKAGLPDGVVNVVPGAGPSAGAALAAHRDVDKLHFTGSTAVGKGLYAASATSNAKPILLETGGKSAQIVFADAAGLDGLGEHIAMMAFINSGQLCVARTRLLVEACAVEPVMDALHKGAEQFVGGSPLDPATSFGPLCSRKQYERVRGYLDIGRAEGAALSAPLGVATDREGGYYVAPRVFTGVANSMRIAQEEIFGPVLSVIPFNDEEEAVALANSVDYGLAATVWTQNMGRARRMARDLDAGRVDIRMSAAAGAGLAELAGEPFNGSGHGALGGREGMMPYLRTKGVQFITP